MDGLDFDTAPPRAALDPARADVACFAGFVARRRRRVMRAGPNEEVLTDVPKSLRAWLRDHHWEANHDGRTQENLNALTNVPVPLDTWDAFDALFAWEQRPIAGTGERCDTALGAAVRDFFGRGGRFCYVVRLGDPWPFGAPLAQRLMHEPLYLKGSRYGLPPSPATRATWEGIAHLFGLPGVAFLCVPDLPEMFSAGAAPRTSFMPPETPEGFIECAARAAPMEVRSHARWLQPPRCDAEGFSRWANCVRWLGEFVRDNLREVHLVAAVPLPLDAEATRGQRDGSRQVRSALLAQWTHVVAINTAFVQLVYPWLRTRDSGALPGGLVAPDGFFTGLLAASALGRGAWRSLVHQLIPDLIGVDPVLDRSTLTGRLDVPGGTRVTVRDHVSVLGPTAGGMRVLSDVTTYDHVIYRSASVGRLVAAVLRAARLAGERMVFDNNGEALWVRVRETMENLLTGFWSQGALLGATAADAFEVRCDRSTMTQADIDAGRLFVRAVFMAAQPITRITVVFAMDEGGDVTLSSHSATPLSAPDSQAA